MPLGVNNVLVVLLNLMNQVFAPYLDKFMVVFIDDVLVYSKNEEEHTEHLKIVLENLRKEKLYGKVSKHEFRLKSVSFL